MIEALAEEQENIKTTGQARTAELFGDFELGAHLRRIYELSWRLVLHLRFMWETNNYDQHQMAHVFDECDLTVCKEHRVNHFFEYLFTQKTTFS